MRVVLGVDRDDPVAVLLHVLRGEVARPVPVGRQADDGEHAALAQDAAQRIDVVHGANTIIEATP